MFGFTEDSLDLTEGHVLAVEVDSQFLAQILDDARGWILALQDLDLQDPGDDQSYETDEEMSLDVICTIGSGRCSLLTPFLRSSSSWSISK